MENDLLPEPPEETDIESRAADFIEQEVGTHRWKANVKALKDQGRLRPMLKLWLQRMGYDDSPDRIITTIQDWSKTRTDQWK